MKNPRLLKRVRDAITGRFVKREEAWRRPESTIIQTFPVPLKEKPEERSDSRRLYLNQVTSVTVSGSWSDETEWNRAVRAAMRRGGFSS